MQTQKDDVRQLELGEAPKAERTENSRQLAIEGLSVAEAGERAETYRNTVIEITTVRLGQLANNVGKESPYQPLASSDGGPLVLKEDPAKDPEVLALLEKFKKKEAMEKLPTLTTAQKIRIREYYGLAKANGKVTDREISSGISSMVRGYWEIGEVRKFAETYAQTGKLPKGLPTPNASFLTAAEKFPGAADFLKEEIDGTKALDEQIGTILEQAALNADKRAAEADKRAAEAERRGAEAERRGAEADRRAAEYRKAGEEADRRAAEYRKQTEALERILKLLK